MLPSRRNAYFQEIEDRKNERRQAKSPQKIACFLGLSFWRDFGRVWGWFWEVEIHDFRCFFDIFSMQNFECNLEGQKIEKNGQQDDEALISAVCAGLGGKHYRMGGNLPKPEIQALP